MEKDLKKDEDSIFVIYDVCELMILVATFVQFHGQDDRSDNPPLGLIYPDFFGTQKSV